MSSDKGRLIIHTHVTDETGKCIGCGRSVNVKPSVRSANGIDV